MNVNNVVRAILNGEFDADMPTLSAAVKERKYTLGRMNYFAVSVGDRVRLVNLRPKYLIGEEGTVTRKVQTRIHVELDTPSPRFGKTVRATPNMIEAI